MNGQKLCSERALALGWGDVGSTLSSLGVCQLLLFVEGSLHTIPESWSRLIAKRT